MNECLGHCDNSAIEAICIALQRAFLTLGLVSLPSQLCSLPLDLSSSFYKLPLDFLARLGLGVPVKSYLEVVLYKFPS